MPTNVFVTALLPSREGINFEELPRGSQFSSSRQDSRRERALEIVWISMPVGDV